MVKSKGGDRKMSNEVFQVRYSQLNQDLLLNELKKRYKSINPISCQLFKTGMNDVYIVKSNYSTFP